MPRSGRRGKHSTLVLNKCSEVRRRNRILRSRLNFMKKRAPEYMDKERTTENKNKDVSDTPNSASKSYVIEKSELLGRYLVSNRNIEAGEIIIEDEKPLVIGPVQQSKPLCLGCYIPIQNINNFRCKRCNWPICQLSCSGLYTEHGHMQEECAVLSDTSFDEQFRDDEANVYNFIVPLRCLLFKKVCERKWKILYSMESHNNIRKNVKAIWEMNEITVVKKLHKYFTAEEIHTVCGILEVNSFEVTKININLRALFPLAYLMSHNCVPNTIHTNDNGFRLLVRAAIPISKNRPITISYTYTLQGTAKRQSHIKETKFFDCACDRCSDSSEMGTHLSTLVCPMCKLPTLVSSSPLKQNSPWICNYKKCMQTSVSQSYVDDLVTKFEEELKMVPEDDVAGYEGWIQKALVSFHENHYLIVGVKYTLGLLYGKVAGFMIQEMSDDLLRHKINICEGLMKIADILEPGLSRLRGMILYELHAPIMILLTRKHEKQKTSKKQLKYSLQRVISYLQEASDILEFEGENTMEGKIGYAAKQALLATHQWEKTIGKFSQ